MISELTSTIFFILSINSKLYNWICSELKNLTLASTLRDGKSSILDRPMIETLLMINLCNKIPFLCIFFERFQTLNTCPLKVKSWTVTNQRGQIMNIDKNLDHFSHCVQLTLCMNSFFNDSDSQMLKHLIRHEKSFNAFMTHAYYSSIFLSGK